MTGARLAAVTAGRTQRNGPGACARAVALC
jgi:hypothetical protein